MDLIAFKWLSIGILLVVGLIGGFLPLWVEKVSKVAVHVAYAFAGGVLGAVALVHMLDDASGDLEGVGADFAKALSNGQKDDFPLGSALFLIGFFLICSIEPILHRVFGGHTYDHNGQEHEVAVKSSDQQLRVVTSIEGNVLDGSGHESRVVTSLLHEESSVGNAAGWSTLIGLTIHSFLEGVAMGVPTDEAQVGALVIAVAAHKGFAAFANSSVNVPLLRQRKRALWIFIVIWFALIGPVGMMIGMNLSANLNMVGTAVVQALAAGSVLSVGITEMLLPAFKDTNGLTWKLLSAWTGMLVMSLLGVWC